MRILLLNQYFRPDLSASAQRITELAEDLATRHDVVALAGRPSYGPVDGIGSPVRPTVRVRHVPSTTFERYRTWPRIVNYLSYLAGALVAGVLSRRADVVIAATDPPLVGVLGLWLSRLHRAFYVHLLWDVQPEVAVAAGLVRPGLLTRLACALNRSVLRHASCVLVPTQAMRATAIALGASPERVHLFPHWEDTDVIEPRPKVNAFSRAHDLADRFVLMYAGNLGLTQDLDCYLELAQRLRDLPDVRLVFVGEGAAKRALERRAAGLGLETVRFLPYQPREEMSASLATADVFLVPLAAGLTRFMLPSKIFTMLAAGRPLIAALDRESDLSDLVTRLQCGYVVHPGDLGAIEYHVRRLHADPEARREMGERGRRAAETLYARSVVTPRLLELLRHLEPVAMTGAARTDPSLP